MRKALATLARQSVVYGFSGAVLQVVGLLTLPVYARAFTPAEYGVVEIGTVGFTALIIAVDAGLGFAMQRFYFEIGEDRPDERRLLTSTATFGSAGVALVLAVIVVALREPLSSAAFGTTEHGDFVALIALSVPLGTLAIFLRDVMRLRFRAWHFAASACLASIVAATIGVVWVTAFDGGVTAVAAGLLAGQAASALFGLVVCRHDVALRFSRAKARALLALGLPLLPAGAAMWGMNFGDRVMLSQLDSLAATGEYAVATRFASVLLFFTGAFATAYTPFLFSLHESDPERERELRARLLTYASALFVGVGLCLSLFAREVADIVAPGYDRAYQIVGILCLGAAAFGLTPITGAGISIAKRTDISLKLTLTAVAGNLALCVALIPWLGLTGAALANAAGYFALALLYLRHSQRLVRAEFDRSRVAAAFLLGAALMPLGLIELDAAAATLAIKIAAILAFLVGLRLIGIFGPREADELRRTVARLRHRPAASVS